MKNFHLLLIVNSRCRQYRQLLLHWLMLTYFTLGLATAVNTASAFAHHDPRTFHTTHHCTTTHLNAMHVRQVLCADDLSHAESSNNLPCLASVSHPTFADRSLLP